MAVVWKKLAYAADLTTHTENTTTAHGAVSAATASKHVVRDGSARAKFAAPGASGDALIKGTRVTTAELPAMTDEKYWVGTGANVEERDVPAAGAATKEFFLPFIRGTDPQTTGNIWPHYYCDGATDWCAASFYVPSDFTTIVEAVLVLQTPDTQAAANWDIYSEYGAVGENRNNHAENDAATTYNVTANQMYDLDISGILSALAAGDYVGVEIINSTGAGHRFRGFGVRFKYT